jgi:hypothetical protein
LGISVQQIRLLSTDQQIAALRAAAAQLHRLADQIEGRS